MLCPNWGFRVPLLVLVVGIAVRAATPETAVCWPMPDIANVTVDCGSGHTSALAGTTCGVQCVGGILDFGLI